MGRRVIWRAAAEQDLSEACLYIARESPAAAERFLDVVERAIAVLVEHPRAGHLRQFRSMRVRDLRSWPTKGFPDYLIFYRTVGDDIEVVRLLHGNRDLPRIRFDDPR